MIRYFSLYIIGLIFGSGIILSGMVDPMKVQNFFDLFGVWDPSLAFVMLGALLISGPAFQAIGKRMQKPALSEHFSDPNPSSLNKRLIIGSALFGIGWGLSGFCPGGLIPGLGFLDNTLFIFLASMLVGIVAAKTVTARIVSVRMPDKTG